jgi:hypothetical protein
MGPIEHHDTAANFSKEHTGPRIAHCFQPSVYIHIHTYNFITKLYRHLAEVIENHEKEYIRNTGQGEASQYKCKKLKLGGG